MLKWEGMVFRILSNPNHDSVTQNKHLERHKAGLSHQLCLPLTRNKSWVLGKAGQGIQPARF